MAEGTIGLAEPSTLTKSLRSVTQNINSSVVHQEVMTLGGAGSSLQIATILAAEPASTDYGLTVRAALPTLLNLTNSTVLTTSTATTLLSSAATTPLISAFVLTSTDTGPITGGFYAGSTLVWPVTLWAGGGIVNVMQHVAAPGYVFAGQAGRPLSFNTAGSSGVTVRVGLTYRQV